MQVTCMPSTTFLFSSWSHLSSAQAALYGGRPRASMTRPLVHLILMLREPSYILCLEEMDARTPCSKGQFHSFIHCMGELWSLC